MGIKLRPLVDDRALALSVLPPRPKEKEKEVWKKHVDNSSRTTAMRTYRLLLGTARRNACIFIVIPMFLLVYYNAVFIIRFFRKEGKAMRHLPDPFPGFGAKTFDPLPKDNVGVPNVVYGCGDNPERKVDEIQLHVIGWRRAESLNTLLEQLKGAEYDGWDIDIPLYIHLDGGSDEESRAIVKNFEWTHGPQYVNTRKNNVGLKLMWLDSLGSAAAEAGNNTLLVAFEDDIRVSIAYFQWLLASIDAYGRNPQCRDSNLVGFSLSPIRVQEMSKPFVRWDAQEAMGSRDNNEHRHLAYLSVVPSSWGAAYWSDQWNEFDKFVRLRIQPPFYDVEAEKAKVSDYSEYELTPKELYIPDARSNVWPKSWKRFMVDFMYARGLVMLYPNLPGEKGLATALQESGEHVSTTTVKNPRVADLLKASLNLTQMGKLARYGDLAVFGLHLLPTTRERLVFQGAKFLNNVWDKCDGCEELIRLWAPPGTTIPGLNKDGILHTCAADHYTSASTALSRPVRTNYTERYLLFEPQYGANNQLHALIEAFFWARALGRRLVVPPVFMPRVSAFSESEAAWSTMADFFQISDTDTSKARFRGPALEPISFDEFKKIGARPWRLLRATHNAIFDDSVHMLTKDLHPKDDIEVINLRHLLGYTISIDRLQHLLGGCQDEVLAFDGLFFANLIGVNPRELTPDVMSLSNHADSLYQSVKKKLVEELGSPEYGCYHVRLGDFFAMCDTLENADASSAFSASYLKTAHEFICTVQPGELTAMIQKDGLPAFVMTDSPKEVQEALDELSIKTLTSSWVEQAIIEALQREVSSSDLQLYGLLIDQHLCADSKRAMLNRFSTVSQRVISLRRGKDYEYWTRAYGASLPSDSNHMWKGMVGK